MHAFQRIFDCEVRDKFRLSCFCLIGDPHNDIPDHVIGKLSCRRHIAVSPAKGLFRIADNGLDHHIGLFEDENLIDRVEEAP